ncbi:MurR/RpiR family transcriptional regulator [Microvirga sp. VF16]|uniref:MurR/RpiR family transcriptional regulator n=1 Tax=Microvirga sp. VF16 TaxID=2807101 RepID=UPI00193EABF1|nr:MurR/RpiR family transcriptional regulator [Microvirga sp. VF16]QRM32379.1 MurR/RpiR family transcriptional regulator [Microvirga sp. VF16]
MNKQSKLDVDHQRDVLLLINARMPSLPSALQRIGKYVIENSDIVVRETINDLSAVTETGPATIIRFCRVLGFSGLKEFKLALAANLARQNIYSEEGKIPPKQFSDVLADNIVQATRETQSVLDEASVRRLADAMVSARRIDIYGAGASGFVASYLSFRLLRIGLPAHAVSDPTLAAYVSTGLSHDAVVIAISESGLTKDTVQSLRMAKVAGATTAAITNHKDAPISKWADVLILTSAVRSPLTGSKLTIAFTHLMAIETLVAILTDKLGLLHIEADGA